VVPKATPLAIVNKLHDNLQAVTKDPGFIGYVEKMGMEVAYMNSTDSLRFLRQSRDNFGRLIKVLNIPTESGVK